MDAPICPFCKVVAKLKEGSSFYRRGKKGVHVQTQHWECQSDCAGPDGSKPYSFLTVGLMKANDKAAKVKWKEFYGEAMPMSAFKK